MSLWREKAGQLFLFIGLLLLVLASRVLYAGELELDSHEVWTMWQSVGTPAQIINRTPFDWGPLYYLVIDGWQSLVGNHFQTARVLSMLWFALGSVFVYRAAAHLRPGLSPFLVVLLYAASGGILYLSLNIRGYALDLALMPLAFWLTLRYFDSCFPWRERKREGILLVVTLAATVYIHPTGLLACLLLGAHTLFAYPRRLWRWGPLVLLLVVLIFPQLQVRFGTAAHRLESSQLLFDLNTIPAFFNFYSGEWVLQRVGWVVLALLALLLLGRTRTRRAFPLLLTVLVGFVMLVVLGGRFGFGGDRHSWWLATPIALLVGWGLSYLPRVGRVIYLGVLIAGLFILPPRAELDESARPNPPLGENFAWLSRRIRWGDVVVLDPRQQCSTFPDEWDYYTRLYFPQHLPVVQQTAGYQRIWYISADGWEDPDLKASILDGRVPTIFNGPWNCLFRLYLAPPDTLGVLYENGMRFHGYEIIEDDQPLVSPLVGREGDSLIVRLWWSVDRPPAADYSIGMHIYDGDDALVSQSDSGPQIVNLNPTDLSAPLAQTSQWTPGQYYVEQRTLMLPDVIPLSTEGTHPYTLALVVYQFWDNVRVAAPGLVEDGRRILQRFTVRAW